MSEIFGPSPLRSLRSIRARRRWQASGTLAIAGAALLWSTLGVFYRLLTIRGLSPAAIAFSRAAGGGVVLAATLALRRRRDLFVSPSDLPVFALGGLTSVSLFYVFYIEAVTRTTVATAVVLLYTAPAWVALISWLAWGEPFTPRRAGALIMAVAGAALTAGVALPGRFQPDRAGVLFGLGAGLTYALYSIYGAWGVARYNVSTVVTYAMLSGSLFLLFWQQPGSLTPIFRSPLTLTLVAGLIAGPTVGAYTLYTRGLARTGAPVASLIATIEPIAATLLAWLVLDERPGLSQMAGGLLILVALTLLLGKAPRPSNSTR